MQVTQLRTRSRESCKGVGCKGREKANRQCNLGKALQKLVAAHPAKKTLQSSGSQQGVIFLPQGPSCSVWRYFSDGHHWGLLPASSG